MEKRTEKHMSKHLRKILNSRTAGSSQKVLPKPLEKESGSRLSRHLKAVSSMQKKLKQDKPVAPARSNRMGRK